MRGQPDFGLYAPKEVTASVSDMGEVAARLGSILIYDKRGDVVDFDNFEGLVPKTLPLTPGAGDYTRLNSENVRSGSQSLKFHTSNFVGRAVEFKKAVPILASEKLGFEASFSKKGDGLYLILEIEYSNAVKRYFATAYLHYDGDKLQIDNELGVQVDVATLPDLYEETSFFHTMKLVVDFKEAKYMRFLFDQNEYDISAILLDPAPIITPYGIFFTITSSNKAAIGGDVWVDDIIITQAEP